VAIDKGKCGRDSYVKAGGPSVRWRRETMEYDVDVRDEKDMKGK
jgi:hypothetical protein